MTYLEDLLINYPIDNRMYLPEETEYNPLSGPWILPYNQRKGQLEINLQDLKNPKKNTVAIEIHQDMVGEEYQKLERFLEELQKANSYAGSSLEFYLPEVKEDKIDYNPQHNNGLDWAIKKMKEEQSQLPAYQMGDIIGTKLIKGLEKHYVYTYDEPIRRRALLVGGGYEDIFIPGDPRTDVKVSEVTVGINVPKSDLMRVISQIEEKGYYIALKNEETE